MLKFLSFALAAGAACIPAFAPAAQPDAFERGMNTMWEVLWHQSGTPTRLVRWDQDIKVRITGVNVAAHRQHTLLALRDAANEAGIKVIDVSDVQTEQANLSVEIVANDQLEANQPCLTRLEFQSETRIDSASMLMRDGDAQRCAPHEAMHMMGVRGHPEGDTVLSYFHDKQQGLMAIDRAMLRAWYSPKVRGGMTPFEVLPVLADKLVETLPDKHQAAKSRDRFFARTVEEMQAFADGKGDVPMIVKRCGKATGEGIRHGRAEMTYFLGVAYMEGATVARDPSQGMQWLQRAASLGNRNALARLSGAGAAQTRG